MATDAGAELPLLPGRVRLVLRAMRRRCPVCGSPRIFRGWFHLRERCPGCGLRFQREPGHWTGDIGINTIVSFGALLITLIAFTLLTWPNLPLGPLLLTAAAVAAITPVVFYPFSKTLWLVVDLSVNPLRPGEAHPRRTEPTTGDPRRRRRAHGRGDP